MNNMNFIKKQLIRLLCIAFISSAYSCNDKMAEELTSVNFDRSFSTTGIDLEEGQTSVLIEWDKALNSSTGTTYTIEIAEEADFSGGAEKTFHSNTNSINLTDADIEVRKDYYARIKTNSEGEKKESVWTYSGKFKITGDQYLEMIKYDDIQSTQVTVRWDASKTVTHLTVNGNRTDLASTDLEDGEKVIFNLTPATVYEVIIWDNLADKGARSFSTKSGLPTGTIKQLVSGANIKLEIEGAQNGDVFVLPQGSQYVSSGTIVIPNGVSITIYGEEGPDKPTLKTSSTGFTLPATAGDIKFLNINFDGTSSQYIINQSAASVVDNLIFENCIITGYANTPFRFQSAGQKTIKNLVVDQCIVGNLSPSQNYAFIHSNVATGVINNISLTNSTFFNIGIGLVLHTGAASSSLLVDNCTIYDVNKGDNDSRYLITYGAFSAGTAEIKNTIFAKTKHINASGVLIAAPGYTATNNYQTSDFVIARDALKNIIQYNGSSADLFEDPANRDFSIKDASFEGRSTAGDPRWR